MNLLILSMWLVMIWKTSEISVQLLAKKISRKNHPDRVHMYLG